MLIPVKTQSDITFGPLGCPVVVVNQDVWHIEQKRIVGTLRGEVYQRRAKALSANGQWFAATSESRDQETASIRVWNTVTGELSCEIPGNHDKYSDLMVFSRNQYLLLGGQTTDEIQVWDVTTGEQQRSIVAPSGRVDDKKTTFSADGQYFTSVDDDRLSVMHTRTRKRTAVMEGPRPNYEPGQPINDIQRKVLANRVISDIEMVRFSPDGTELAAIIDFRRPRLVCWSFRGKLVFDQVIPRVHYAFTFGRAFEWLPDGSGWIISGHVYDRETKRIAFVIRPPFGDDPLFFPLDRNRLVGAFPHDRNTLQVIDIPWNRINASMKLLDDQAPAALSPYTPVSIEFHLGELRGNADAIQNTLGDALVKRLLEDGIHYQAGRPNTFRLRFSEKAGDTLPIYEKQTPFDFRGHDTGRTATEAKGSLVVELVSDGEVLWRDTVEASSASSFREAINDATIRKSMLENMTLGLERLSMPYFVPKSPDHMALPIVLE